MKSLGDLFKLPIKIEIFACLNNHKNMQKGCDVKVLPFLKCFKNSQLYIIMIKCCQNVLHTMSNLK